MRDAMGHWKQQMRGMETPPKPPFVVELERRLLEEGLSAFPYRIGQEVQAIDPKTGTMEKWSLHGVEPHGPAGSYRICLVQEASSTGKTPLRYCSLDDFFAWNQRSSPDAELG